MKIKEFLARNKGLSENTLKAYEQSLWQLFGAIKGDEPTVAEISQFLLNYKSSSLHRHKAAFKAYFEYMKREWPFTRRDFPKSRRRIPRYFPPSRVPELIEAAGPDPDDKFFVKTSFQLGTRISEAMAITKDVILPDGVKVIGKGDEEKLIPTLKEFNAELTTFARKKHGRLFPKTYNYYDKLLKKSGAAIGVPDITLHMLRHARAVDLLKKKMPLPFVQQFLRHARLDTTAIYLEITGGELGQELQRYENEAKEGNK